MVNHNIKYDKNDRPYSIKTKPCDACRTLSIQRIPVKCDGKTYDLCPYCHEKAIKNLAN